TRPMSHLPGSILPFSQHGLNVLFDVVSINHARISRGEPSLAIDKKRIGHAGNSVPGRYRIVAQHNAIRNPGCFDKWLHDLPIVIERTTDNRQALRGILLMKLGEPGNFLFAAMTPGRPEIQHNNLAAILRQSGGFAEAVLEIDLGRRLALAFRLENGT